MLGPSIWAQGDYEAVAARIVGIADEVVAAVGRRRALADVMLVDLACGTGSAAFAAARRGARVTAVDTTPELLAVGAEKATRESVPIAWRVADASNTGLPTASVDAAVSSMGIIFVEPRRQVAELARLLRPAGVVGLSAWVRVADNPLIDPITAILGRPPGSTFSPDEWAEPATAVARLSPAFNDFEIAYGIHTWEFESTSAALDFVVTKSPMHVSAVHRAGVERNRLVAAFEAAFAAHTARDGRVRFDAPYAVVTALRD